MPVLLAPLRAERGSRPRHRTLNSPSRRRKTAAGAAAASGADRRLGLHLPRLPRAAADDAAGRHAGERRVRLHQHAGQAAEGPCRHPYRGHLRRRPADLPQPALRRLQGAPPAAARRTDPAIRPGARGDRGVRRALDRTGRLGGRRPDRRLRPRGRGMRRPGHHRVVRQGPDAAHPARRRRCWTRSSRSRSARPR